MSKKLAALLLAICILLSGCSGGGKGGDETTITVYRLDSDAVGCALVREKIDVQGDKLEASLAALNAQPADTGLLSAFPEGVQVLDCTLEKGRATVEMSPGYLTLGGQEKLLVDGAVVLSLSTLDGVCLLDIVCGGKIAEVGLCLEDFAETDGLAVNYERTLKVYLPDEGLSYILPKSLSVNGGGEISTEILVLQEVFSAIGRGMENTRILSAVTENGICRVDLSAEFYGAEPAGGFGGMVMLYSIVNSLCRLKGVESVSISVEGNELTNYGGFSPYWPLGENMGFVRFE